MLTEKSLFETILKDYQEIFTNKLFVDVPLLSTGVVNWTLIGQERDKWERIITGRIHKECSLENVLSELRTEPVLASYFYMPNVEKLVWEILCAGMIRVFKEALHFVDDGESDTEVDHLVKQLLVEEAEFVKGKIFALRIALDRVVNKALQDNWLSWLSRFAPNERL
jgi:hypothetical protein